ncbi:MAG: metal ABC transporter permease [Candidatus Zixiibacteriota bacterium]|nr:MAG: metal ABC transporter permease [candidate division Zixibacteria bacterium]HDL03100.1 metal ABC transporter permease [candidate division Zixibacteria bacterium]
MTSISERGKTVSEFIDALMNHAFLQYAMLTGVLASIACGIVGTYVVTRRITYIGGGIAHSILGGMGVAYFLSATYKWNNLHPLYGALVAAILAAVVIGLISLRTREREDTVISSLWAVGMAVGILFISRTPGYNQDLMSYLFGNILMVTSSDLWLIIGLDILVAIIGVLFYNQLTAVCFDEEFARVRGLNVSFYYLLLLCLTALTVVILVTVVGVVMVIALLTLPVAVAGHFTRTMWGTMILATILSMIFVVIGLAVSYGPNLPAGATIILIAGLVYLIVAVGAGIFRYGREF